MSSTTPKVKIAPYLNSIEIPQNGDMVVIRDVKGLYDGQYNGELAVVEYRQSDRFSIGNVNVLTLRLNSSNKLTAGFNAGTLELVARNPWHVCFRHQELMMDDISYIAMRKIHDNSKELLSIINMLLIKLESMKKFLNANVDLNPRLKDELSTQIKMLEDLFSVSSIQDFTGDQNLVKHD